MRVAVTTAKPPLAVELSTFVVNGGFKLIAKYRYAICLLETEHSQD
jgi:hypothetical protein